MYGRYGLTAACLLGALLFGCQALAQKKYDTGASDTEIKLGQTMPYSGGASAYGVVGRAEAAYFRMVNERGGVNGRRINLISVDDGYAPPKTLEVTRSLVENEGVLAIFGSLGTPTNSAIQRYLNGRRVPHLFVATGASKWDDRKNFPWTMGWAPHYKTEAAIFARYVLENIPDARIAILYQNDDFGKDYLVGLRERLGERAAGMIVREASYEVTDPTIDSQILLLQASGANVFFSFTTPKFAAMAIRKVHEIGWRPTFFLNNGSSSIGGTLAPAGMEKAVGIISSQFLKEPSDPAWKDDSGVAEYLEWIRKYHPGGDPSDWNNAWGYSSAQTMVRVLEQAGDVLTRENVMKQAASLKNLALPMLLPGITINTAEDDWQPIDQQQLVRFDGKSWVAFGEVLADR